MNVTIKVENDATQSDGQIAQEVNIIA